MKGDSLGRDGIDARLNRARSPIPAKRGIAGKFIWKNVIVGNNRSWRSHANRGINFIFDHRKKRN